MISLPDITVPAVTRLPVDQMEMGLDLLRTVHAALQDHTFIDCDTLLALSGTMFVALDALGPVPQPAEQSPSRNATKQARTRKSARSNRPISRRERCIQGMGGAGLF